MPEKTELRCLCPTELAAALDAIAMAKGMDRNSYVIQELTLSVKKYLAVATVVQRALQGNPLLSECEGKA